VEQQHSRWRPTRRQVLWTAGTFGSLAFLIIVICGYLFGWKWTGLPGRTLWNWLDLLIVPAVLALGGYLFALSENRRTQETANQQRELDRKLAQQRAETDRKIADDRQQDTTLQAYLDGMAQLLIDKEQPLHRAQQGDSLSSVARARTLTVLPRLDGDRKARVVQFLYESGLIAGAHPILDLSGADLFEADLRGADLRKANLSEANLRKANLAGADLAGADLRKKDRHWSQADLSNLSQADLRGANLGWADLNGANLSEAYLGRANLSEARLSEATLSGAILGEADLSGAKGVTERKLEESHVILERATMPDGSIHD
jgi:uncharacterized protein YjbI with pentapeptide repeats